MKIVHGLAFGTPKFYIAPYGKINHGLVNLSYNCDVKSGLNVYVLNYLNALWVPNIERWMDGRLMILHPFQQYFSHIRMWPGDNERLLAKKTRLWLRRFHLEQESNPGPLNQ